MPIKSDSVRIRTDKRGNIRYEVSHFSQGKRYWQSYPSRYPGKPDPLAESAAKSWKQAMIQKAIAGKLGLPEDAEKAAPTYESARDEFLAMMRPTWSEDTYEDFYKRTLRTVWDPKLTGRRLDSITTAEIRAELLERYGAGRKHRSLQVYRQVLSALFNWAMESGREYVKANPAKAAKLPRAKEAPPKLTYRLHELQAFLRHVPATHQLLFRVLAFTGLRRSELYRMRWDWVDFNRGELHVREGKTGYHVVPLARALLEELRVEHDKRQAEAVADERDISHAPIFSPDGKRVDHRKTMVSAAKAAKTPTDGLGYHTFRYTLCSIIERMPGASWSVVQLVMRHARKSAGVTGIYVSSDRDVVRTFLDALVTDVDGQTIATPVIFTAARA